MTINGFNKTTLLDYPGKIASTIFLGGCNFRCPFCHNSGLVLSPKEQPVIPVHEVLQVLKKRQGILEGVCITGGEPTQNKELFLLIDRIKELGYPILLGTSRKSVVGLTLDTTKDERVEGTMVTTVYGVQQHCAFVRVHDVKENMRAIRMTYAIMRGFRKNG